MAARAPLVSIITPVYNAARWLPRTIASVQAQTHPAWEWLLVDDGSTDESVSLAGAAAAADPRIRVEVQSNAGPGVARNTGLVLARGDFLQYLDADDLLGPEKIARQLARLERTPGRVASCAWARIQGDAGPETALFEREPVWADFAPVDWLVTSAMGGGMMATAAWLVPRGIAERAGPWMTQRSPNDDGEYFARVLLASEGVTFVEDALVYYRSEVGGWSGARSHAAAAGVLASFASIARHLRAAEDSPRTRRALAAHYQRFVYGTYPDHPDLVRDAEATIDALGETPLAPPTGGLFGAVSRVTGWKLAQRLRRLRRR